MSIAVGCGLYSSIELEATSLKNENDLMEQRLQQVASGPDRIYTMAEPHTILVLQICKYWGIVARATIRGVPYLGRT